MLVKYRMTPDPIIVRPDVSIAEALDQMRQDGVHRYPVVDARGKLVGIVTESDLLYASPSSVTSPVEISLMPAFARPRSL